MEAKDAWDKFYNSGNIADYIDYIDIVRTEAEALEQNREGNSDSGNGLS